jgi:tetratricopeptide (TPR) repeat protein
MPVILAVIFTVTHSHLKAQESIDFKNADSLTYHFYETGNWQELIESGKSAIHQGLDYYFLRMRIGIAYFELGRYRAAGVHFEKALEFYSNDKVAMQYLQKSYNWGGMETESVALAHRFSFLKKDGVEPVFIRGFSVFGGAAVSGSSTQLKNTDLDGEANIYGEINANGNMYYGHAGITVAPLQHLRLYLGYTRLKLEKNQRIVMEGADSMNNRYNLIQHQFHANLPLRIAKGWQIIPAFTILNFRDKPLIIGYDTVNYEYLIRQVDTTITNYIVSLKLLKSMPYYDVGAMAGNSNLNNKDQWQGTFILNLYPFANLDLYSYSRISTLKAPEEYRWHFRQTLGGKVLPKLWLQGSYQWGDLTNAYDENGLLVFNTSAEISSRLSAAAFILITEKLTLQLEYTFTKQQDTYIEFIDYNTFIMQPVNYNNHNFMGGLTWKL